MKSGSRLSEIEAGQKVKIVSFENDEIILKLMEMGCLPGEAVIVEKIAPMGGPLSIVVAGYHLSLRKDEADKIFVDAI